MKYIFKKKIVRRKERLQQHHSNNR